MKSIAEQLFDLAHETARDIPEFNRPKGPGKNAGNGVTNRFIRTLNDKVQNRWPGEVIIQATVVNKAKYSFDFYIPCEKTAVEIALSLYNSLTEFEKDVFKAVLAKDNGKPLNRLVLIGKSGSRKRQNEPGPRAIKEWVKRKCSIEIEVRDVT